MKPPPRPINEGARLEALRRYAVLDTLPEQSLDDLTRLASVLCDTPVSQVSLIDGDRQFIKSSVGLANIDTPREFSFCAHTILGPGLLIVADTATDERFADNPLVTGAPHIRFYAGAPLVTPEGEALGALCVIDRIPRELTASQQEGLQILSGQAMAQLELRRRTDELRFSHERFQIVARATNDVVWDWDLVTDALWWNEGYQLQFGYPPEETDPTIASWTSQIHPDDAERVGRGLHAVIERSGQSWSDEYRFRRKDGSYRTIFDRGFILRDDTGRAVRMIGAMQDLTERRETEAARWTSDTRYRTLFDYAPDGILIADAGSVYLDANPSICRMLGLSRQELIGLCASDIVDVAEVPNIEPALIAITSHNEYHREWKFRRKDGSTFSAEVIATAMPDGKLLAMIRDISERKRAEARLRRLVDSNAQGVIFWNASGEITAANDAFLATVGYSREDLEAGRIAWPTLTPPEYAILDDFALAEIARSGACTPFEKEYFRKDGSRVPILIGAANFEDNPAEGVCFILDLTERKKLEQQFLRTQRLESIGTLAGGIAHDLNNVLAPILLSVEMLKDHVSSADGFELLATLEGSAQHGADLVKQVLTFARGIEGQRIAVNPIRLVRDLLKVIRDTFAKSIQVGFVPAPDLWSVTGDPTQLHQVFLNLCVNARDAMPNGGDLTLSLTNVELDANTLPANVDARPGPYVLVTVEDTGTGIPAAIRGRILEPFFTTKEIGKGTGLGLSTASVIVKSHGGFIQLYSELGQGSRFAVYLPANSTTPAAQDLPVARPGMPRGQGELILVVDDEKAIRKVAQRTLERFGYRVVLASDGGEALASYERLQGEIAVVLTDMAMPIMDGPALIVALRKLHPGVRIIGSSGLASSSSIAEVTGTGLQHFVPKPYTAEALLKVLHQILHGEGDSG